MEWVKSREFTKGNWRTANWSFATFCFTLFCRGANTQELTLPCFSISQDGIDVDFAMSKCNQAGEKSSEAEVKALHANPFDNVLCPFLALAVHLSLSQINIHKDENLRVFQGMLMICLH